MCYTQPAGKRHVNKDLHQKEKPMHRVCSYQSVRLSNSILRGSTELNPRAQVLISAFPRTAETLLFSLAGLFSKALNDEQEQGTHRDCQPQLCSCPCFTDSPANLEVVLGFLHFTAFGSSSGHLKSPRQSTAFGRLLCGQCGDSRDAATGQPQDTHVQLSPSCWSYTMWYEINGGRKHLIYN